MLLVDSSSQPTYLLGKQLNGFIGNNVEGCDIRHFIVADDPFYQLISSGRYYFPLDRCSVFDAFTYGRSTLADSARFSTKPRSYPYDPDSSEDFNLYGSILQNLQSARALLLQGDTSSSVICTGNTAGEKYTRQANFRGKALRNVESLITGTVSTDYGDVNSTFGYSCEFIHLYGSDLSDLSFTVEYDPAWSVSYDITPVLRYVALNGLHIPADAGYNDVNNFRWSFDGISLSIGYDFHTYDPHNSVSAHVTMLIPCLGIPSIPHSGDNRTPSTGQASVSWSDSSSSLCNHSINDGTAVFNFMDAAGLCFLEVPSGPSHRYTVSSDTYNPLFAQVRLYQYLYKYEHILDDYEYDIRCSAYISSASASDDLNSQLGTQALVHLKPFLILCKGFDDLLSNFTPNEIASAYGHSNLSMVAGKIGLGGFSGSKARTIALVVDTLLLQLSEFLSNLDANIKIRAHGNFRYTFMVGGDSYELLTHSTIVLDSTLVSVITALTGESLTEIFFRSLLSGSRVPLLSVAAGLSGVYTKLTGAVDSLFLSTLPIVFIHSYRVDKTLSQLELSDIGLTSSSDDPVIFRWYRRDISRYSPPPRYRRLSFGDHMLSSDDIARALVRALINSIQV